MLSKLKIPNKDKTIKELTQTLTQYYIDTFNAACEPDQLSKNKIHDIYICSWNVDLTLLSQEEYRCYKPHIPYIETDWWLRSRGYDVQHACYVKWNTGYVYGYGAPIDNTLGVRPAIKAHWCNHNNLKPGNKIRVGNKIFTILSWEEMELFALCDDIIARRSFDHYFSIWDDSTLSQWLSTEGRNLIFDI